MARAVHSGVLKFRITSQAYANILPKAKNWERGELSPEPHTHLLCDPTTGGRRAQRGKEERSDDAEL